MERIPLSQGKIGISIQKENDRIKYSSQLVSTRKHMMGPRVNDIKTTMSPISKEKKISKSMKK